MLWAAAALAQTPAPSPPKPDAVQGTVQIKDVKIPKLASRPKIEEFLNGGSRLDMRRIDDFRQRNPGDGESVSRKTVAYLGYDDKNIYAAFVCESPAGQTRARMSKREDVMSDDIVGLFLDTFHDRRHGYEFFVNAYGVQADALLNEGGNDEFSFDTLWYSDGRLTETGFTALIAIPFKSLRFVSDDMQTWGIGAARFIPANNEASFWPYITNRVSGFVPQLGNGSGFENISPGRNFQIVPYASYGYSHGLDTVPPIPLFNSKSDPRVGMDMKAVIHDALTLDVTLNPDFAQVESDDPQVTVNQRFAVFFPEKRPFFLENVGYFSTPENLFFSRQVVDPEFGARLTGKIGRWNVGLLATDDRAPGMTEDPTNPLYNKRAYDTVARVQREFLKESAFGLLVTDRELNGGYNRVEAADTRLKFGPNWTFNGQAILSQTNPNDGSGQVDGTAYNASVNRSSRTMFYNLNYEDISPGFQSQLGFIPRVDFRQVNQFTRRNFFVKKSKYLVSYSPRLFTHLLFDHEGRQQEWGIGPGFNLEFKRSTFFGIGVSRGFERYGGINFQHHDVGWGVHSEYFKKFTLDFNLDQGTRLVYSPAGNLNSFRGDGSNFVSTLTFRPISRLKLDEIYFYTSLHTRADSFDGWSSAPAQAGASVFTNHLIRSRLNYRSIESCRCASSSTTTLRCRTKAW